MLKQLEVGKLYATKADGERSMLCITKIGEKFIEFMWVHDGSEHSYGDPEYMLRNLVEVKC